MEIAQKTLKNINGDRLLREVVLVVVFLLSSIHYSVAQSEEAVPDSSGTVVASDSSGAPSITNLVKNLRSSDEELKKIRKDEILSYVYMGLGFSVVIAIAWFTTVLARKRKRREDEIKAMRHQQMKNKLHPPRR